MGFDSLNGGGSQIEKEILDKIGDVRSEGVLLKEPNGFRQNAQCCVTCE